MNELKKIWHVCNEILLSLTENEILICATIWMNLENMPSETNQSQMTTQEISKIGNFIEIVDWWLLGARVRARN